MLNSSQFMGLKYPPNQAKPSILGTYWSISQSHELGITNRIAKQVLLNAINPTFVNISFLSLRGAMSSFG